MSSPSPTFVPLTSAVQPRLLTLMQRIYPPVYAHFWPDGGAWYVESQYGVANFAREIQTELADYRFVVLDDQPVSIVRLQFEVPCPDRPVMTWCQERARQSGAQLLWLEAMDSAAEALGFYQQVGFKITAPFVLDMPRMYPELRGMYRLALPLTTLQRSATPTPPTG